MMHVYGWEVEKEHSWDCRGISIEVLGMSSDRGVGGGERKCRRAVDPESPSLDRHDTTIQQSEDLGL